MCNLHLRNSSIPTGDLVRPGGPAHQGQPAPSTLAEPQPKGKFPSFCRKHYLGYPPLPGVKNSHSTQA